MFYRWNADAMRYIDERGRFVSRREVRAGIDYALRNEQTAVRRLAAQVRTGSITISQFQQQMRERLKNIHIYSAAAARGGFAQLTQADYGTIGQRLRTQYTYLDRFAGEIEAGLPLDGRFGARAELYAQSGRSTYHVIDRSVHQQNGYDQEHSWLGIADHCDECIDQEARGWVSIGSLVPIGSRQCLGRCHCTIDYRRSRGVSERRTDSDDAQGGSYMGPPRGALEGRFTQRELELARLQRTPRGVPAYLDPIEVKAARVRQRSYPAEWKNTSTISGARREALREKWVDDHRADLVAKYGEPARERQAVIVIGPPAAGKTSVITDPLAVKYRAIAPDADGIKALIPEFDAGINAAGVHLESTQILKKVLDDIIDNGENFVYQGLGKTLEGPDGMRAFIDMLNQKGYEVHLYLNELSPEETAGRALGRYLHTGRLVPPDYILNSVKRKPTETFKALYKSKQIKSYGRYVNDQTKEQGPRLVQKSKNAADPRNDGLRRRAAARDKRYAAQKSRTR